MYLHVLNMLWYTYEWVLRTGNSVAQSFGSKLAAETECWREMIVVQCPEASHLVIELLGPPLGSRGLVN